MYADCAATLVCIPVRHIKFQPFLLGTGLKCEGAFDADACEDSNKHFLTLQERLFKGTDLEKKKKRLTSAASMPHAPVSPTM